MHPIAHAVSRHSVPDSGAPLPSDQRKAPAITQRSCWNRSTTQGHVTKKPGKKRHHTRWWTHKKVVRAAQLETKRHACAHGTCMCVRCVSVVHVSRVRAVLRCAALRLPRFAHRAHRRNVQFPSANGWIATGMSGLRDSTSESEVSFAKKTVQKTPKEPKDWRMICVCCQTTQTEN